MATTTTNFGWDIPQSTDLVKDGATAIAALGQDIDTAFVDFKGGTTGQVLKKTSGTDLDVEWGTASSGLTLINTTSFSGVSSHSLATNTFTSTYDAYRIVFTNLICSGNNQMRLRFRKAGTDNTSSIYYGGNAVMTWSGSVIAGLSAAAATSSSLFQLSTVFNTASLDITQPLVRPQVTGLAMSAGPEDRGSFLSAFINTSDTFDSATFFPSAGTITGSVSVYGYNK